jgi:osmotically inducible lipoprotein OsmB
LDLKGLIMIRISCLAVCAALALAGCGSTMESRAATGAATGLVVAGPVGAAVGAAVGAVVQKVDEQDGKTGN